MTTKTADKVEAQISAATTESIEKGKEYFAKSLNASEELTKTYMDFAKVAAAGVEALGKKAYDTAVANAYAMFDGSKKAMGAKDMMEFSKISQDNAKLAAQTAAAQMKDMAELYTNVFKNTYDAGKIAAQKSADKLTM